MPTTSYAQHHNIETERVANLASFMYSPFVDAEELFCWYKPGSGRLDIAATRPSDDHRIAFGERIPSDLTQSQLVQWFAARTANVPYLPTGTP